MPWPFLSEPKPVPSSTHSDVTRQRLCDRPVPWRLDSATNRSVFLSVGHRPPLAACGFPCAVPCPRPRPDVWQHEICHRRSFCSRPAGARSLRPRKDPTYPWLSPRYSRAALPSASPRIHLNLPGCDLLPRTAHVTVLDHSPVSLRIQRIERCGTNVTPFLESQARGYE